MVGAVELLRVQRGQVARLDPKHSDLIGIDLAIKFGEAWVKGGEKETFKKLTLGDQPSYKLIERMAKRGINVSTVAGDLLDHSLRFGRRDLALIRTTVEDLGLETREATLDQICIRGNVLGLRKCPPETAAYLRLAYQEQPLGEVLYMAMDPVKTPSASGSVIFTLERAHGALSLNSTYGDGRWLPSAEFVFVSSRAKAA